MEGVYIPWTIENWITVMLMAIAGYLLFALTAQIFQTGGTAKSDTGKPTLRVVV